MSRKKRKSDEIRPVSIQLNYLDLIPASTLIKQGNTIVLVNSTINDSVPSFLKGSGRGWITSQYAMLPRSSNSRIKRERDYISGRTYEIQRLIGRVLRQAFDISKFGERTILVDCDVIQADGGTRTASITGAFVSVYEVLREMTEMKEIGSVPVKNWIAALSAGIIDGEILLDLNYEEDSNADVDANIVLNREGEIVEIQSTGEKGLFSLDEFNEIISLSTGGIKELIKIQKQALHPD